ncbi:DUF1565 domain-containing protein [Mucilaginibacter ximonensis]|uniref:DUF1565 domain-containing protein n=1 Tax=Mucilaginibacter ximonensis TaxID=538021 RepID=A0ABW5Y6C6_9SPHI
MSATYNWAYKPGVTNKYGISIASSADNVRPSNACYVALYGNDTTGNGSRQYPYRTITKAVNTVNPSNTVFVLGSGVYREMLTGVVLSYANFVGDGDVTIDVSYFTTNLWSGQYCPLLYNITFKGNGSSCAGFAQVTTIKDCVFDGASPSDRFQFGGGGILTNVIIKNYLSVLYFQGQIPPLTLNNMTFVNCNALSFRNDTLSAVTLSSCIFYKCNITFQKDLGPNSLRYSLFYQCNFRFNVTIDGSGGAVYPNVPAGYTYYSDFNAMKTAYSSVFPTYPSFTGCTIADPKFNNPFIGDYTLAFDSPAKNLSYFGTYIGVSSIAQSIKARAIESAGGFEFSSALNINIADDSITLSDSTIDGQIDTKPIVNLMSREIAKLPSYGFNADRNGQYIDSIADLDITTSVAGSTLSIPAPYIVENGTIVYNGFTYQPGDRFTTIAGQTTFTTVANGVVREIIEAPQRHTIMARFGDGGTSVSVGTALTLGYYYYVSAGSITYDSIIYNFGDIFRAVDTNSFSGAGSVIIALSTESFQHYEPGIKPTSNNTGDMRTGSIIRGNGDPAYIRGGLSVQEFPVNAKFIQIRYIIKANNLKP